jgi:hypothetical protein
MGDAIASTEDKSGEVTGDRGQGIGYRLHLSPVTCNLLFL